MHCTVARYSNHALSMGHCLCLGQWEQLQSVHVLTATAVMCCHCWLFDLVCCLVCSFTCNISSGYEHPILSDAFLWPVNFTFDFLPFEFCQLRGCTTPIITVQAPVQHVLASVGPWPNWQLQVLNTSRVLLRFEILTARDHFWQVLRKRTLQRAQAV